MRSFGKFFFFLVILSGLYSFIGVNKVFMPAQAPRPLSMMDTLIIDTLLLKSKDTIYQDSVNIIILDKIGRKKVSVIYKRWEKTREPYPYEITGLWADSVFNTLTPEERIAQLFMVAAYSNRDHKHRDEIDELIQKYKIGGLIFFQGGPVRQAKFTNHFQAVSRVPLMISIDGEWGLAMRLDSTVRYPKQMALGAIQDDSLIYEMGRQIAYECKRLGIHVNFAPVVDINSNSKNPVIGVRSFGANKFNVAKKGVAYMKGLQDAGVMANAKHFPGHGDTDADSHLALPVINHSQKRIDSLELYPFKELMKEGLGSLMVAHLFIPAFDTTKNAASTLSKTVVTNLLQDSLKFKGLIFTDALNMKGVSEFHKPGEVDVKALLAGNDVLLFAENVPVAIEQIKASIDSGMISQAEIDKRCMKILRAKEWAGLSRYEPIEMENLYRELNTSQSDLLNRKLIEQSLTLLNNKDNIIPLKRLDTLRIATLSIGDEKINTFQNMAANYAPMVHYNLPNEPGIIQMDSIIKKLSDYNLVLIGLNNTTSKPAKNFGISAQAIMLIDSIHKKSKVILSVNASAYALANLPIAREMDGLIMGYEDTYYTQNLTSQMIFGGISASGKLPVDASLDYPLGSGIKTNEIIRFKYTIPEELAIDSKHLKKVDEIVFDALNKNAAPGCQILVAKDGKVFYQKSFGYHTYENKQRVTNNDIYDLASVTKIAASVLSIMKLQEEGKIDIDKTLGDYLPELKGTNKDSIVIREMLAHQSGLKPWIPFWTTTMFNGEYDARLYTPLPNDSFPNRVANNLYMHKAYADSIFNKIVRTSLNEKKEYVYSDLGYYFLQRIIQNVTGKPLDQHVQSSFYNQLGLSTLGYKPRDKFSLERIIPTEYDIVYRKQLIHGDVHDQGAAMMGGVAGHAGLFSNANDVGILMQMFLNGGTYGGENYLDKKILNEFTQCQFENIGNRRGAGFDKPEPRQDKDSPVCRAVSLASYGHSGFTGTFAWSDPETNLVYIFLSNRIYPDAENKKLTTLNVRSRIHETIYQAIKR